MPKSKKINVTTLNPCIPLDCNQGYEQDPTGTFCQDTDECLTEVCGEEVCSNNDGSYTCSTCGDGYFYVDETCTDVNECENDYIFTCGNGAVIIKFFA